MSVCLVYLSLQITANNGFKLTLLSASFNIINTLVFVCFVLWSYIISERKAWNIWSALIYTISEIALNFSVEFLLKQFISELFSKKIKVTFWIFYYDVKNEDIHIFFSPFDSPDQKRHISRHLIFVMLSSKLVVTLQRF